MPPIAPSFVCSLSNEPPSYTTYSCAQAVVEERSSGEDDCTELLWWEGVSEDQLCNVLDSIDQTMFKDSAMDLNEYTSTSIYTDFRRAHVE